MSPRDKRTGSLLVTLPYRENGLLAIIREARRRGIDCDVVGAAETDHLLVGPLKRLRRAKLYSGAIEGTREVGLPGELVRRSANLSGSRLLAMHGMYAQKRLFDTAVARSLPPRVDVVIGMPGASLQTFRALPSAVKVLHAVDAHPREHNAEILAFVSARDSRADLRPAYQIERLEKELALADLVVVPSSNSRAHMQERGVPAEKLRVVPYGVNLDRFAIEATEPSTDHTRRERPLILFVGQVSLRKGVRQLIEAARGVDADFVLAGVVFDRSAIQDVPPNVQLIGAVPHSELHDLYASADAFVLPTLGDTFALVIAEAAASGLPVITTSAAGAAEALNPEHHAVIPPGDVAALGRALSDVRILTGERRSQIADDIRSRGRFSDWDTFAGSVLDSSGL